MGDGICLRSSGGELGPDGFFDIVSTLKAFPEAFQRELENEKIRRERGKPRIGEGSEVA
ncbi:unnamed protein product [Sphenostylis stenocarpa]|uniref:Uncharacterized protein n=1 Tax=Sphenostylis stenocarpa TaxID=92480 RepID=A0AA86SBX7_9FABA|nr:unnamed protein product [Sphenostylis stenocarpa]